MFSILNSPILLSVINKFIKDNLLCCPRSCICKHNLGRNVEIVQRDDIIKLINNLELKICLFNPDGTKNVRFVEPKTKP